MVTVDILRGPSRLKNDCHARQDAWLEIYHEGYSMPRIGRFFNRDHTTVLHGIKAAKARAG